MGYAKKFIHHHPNLGPFREWNGCRAVSKAISGSWGDWRELANLLLHKRPIRRCPVAHSECTTGFAPAKPIARYSSRCCTNTGRRVGKHTRWNVDLRALNLESWDLKSIESWKLESVLPGNKRSRTKSCNKPPEAEKRTTGSKHAQASKAGSL